MLTAMLLSLCASLGAVETPVPAGTQLNFHGSLQRRDEQMAAASRKTFDLTLWVVKSDDSGAEALWIIDERGHGQWPWTERFGRVMLDADWRASGQGPALLYDRGDGKTAVPLLVPLIGFDKPLASDAAWEEGALKYTVERSTKLDNTTVWEIAVRDAFGPKRTLWVDQKRPLLTSLSERVMMGRGEEYELHLVLDGSEELSPEAVAKLNSAMTSLISLRSKLNLPTRSQVAEWKPKQLETLTDGLPVTQKLAAGTAVEKLTTAAERDIKLQSGRTTAVADLGAQCVGQAVKDFSAKSLTREDVTQDNLKGKVTVLHFWEYRDSPLQEPYGQVAYLDFINHKREPDGLQVYGVMVDGRLSDEKTRGAAERSAKKLKQFMNLSYPILLDSGGLLKQFGDPRLLGAALPLFVVVGSDGKVLHYHVGNYEVDRDKGLKELDEVVATALGKNIK